MVWRPYTKALCFYLTPRSSVQRVSSHVLPYLRTTQQRLRHSSQQQIAFQSLLQRFAIQTICSTRRRDFCSVYVRFERSTRAGRRAGASETFATGETSNKRAHDNVRTARIGRACVRDGRRARIKCDIKGVFWDINISWGALRLVSEEGCLLSELLRRSLNKNERGLWTR